MIHRRTLNPVNAHDMIIVTDELVWKEDMVEEEEEGDWEECSDEDDSEEDDEGDEAPDLVDITSTKKVSAPSNFSSTNPPHCVPGLS